MARFDHKRLTATFLRFLVVGVIATSVHYAVLITSVELLGWGPVLASGLGYSLGAIVNYLLNRRYTFRSDAPHGTAVIRFLIVILAGLGINVLLMNLFTVHFGLPYLVSQVLTTGIVLFWNFAGNALWSFAHPGERKRGEAV
jgi:putative flippase GtrA